MTIKAARTTLIQRILYLAKSFVRFIEVVFITSREGGKDPAKSG
jgi:hypothetical protein